MAAGIRASEPRGLYPSVNLRGRDAGVAEQLLDAAQVRAAVQEVRREAVAQRVRGGSAGDAGPLGPHPQPPPHVARAQRAPGLAQEQSPLRAGGSHLVLPPRMPARTPAPAVPARGRPGPPSARPLRSARSASCGPCPRRATARRRDPRRRAPARPAPRRAARRRRPARTAPGRGSAAARPAGCSPAARRPPRPAARAASAKSAAASPPDPRDSARSARARAGWRTAPAAPRACAPCSPVPAPLPRGAPRSGAARADRRPPAPVPGPSPTRRTAPGRTRRPRVSAARRRGGADPPPADPPRPARRPSTRSAARCRRDWSPYWHRGSISPYRGHCPAWRAHERRCPTPCVAPRIRGRCRAARRDALASTSGWPPPAPRRR